MMIRVVFVGLGLWALSGCVQDRSMTRKASPAPGASLDASLDASLEASLEGGPWLVEALNGAGAPKNVSVDITFEPGDQNSSVVFGTSGCNRFRGGWQQTGTAIKLGPLATTMMMCEPAQMETERTFLRLLDTVRLVTFDSSGAAVLTAPGGQALKLRRAAK